MFQKVLSSVIALLFAHLVAGGAAFAAGPESKAPTGKPIKIGVVAELSGPLGFWGLETSRAATLVAKEINASGGLLNRPIEIIVRDSKTTVNDAVRQGRDLLFNENVDFLMHSIDSAECVALGTVAKQAKKILFSNCATENFTAKNGNAYVFRVPNITTRTQGYAAAEYVHTKFQQRGHRYYTIASDFAFGRGAVAAFKEKIRSLDPKAEFIGEAWPKVNEASYASFIGAMTEAKPDVVFFAWGIGIPFWQQSAGLGLPQKFAMVSSYWAGSDELQVLPKKAVPVGAVMGGFPWYAINDPKNAAFVEGYRKAYGKAPPTPAYFQFISMQALVAAVNKAKTIDTPAVIKALEGLKFNSVVGPVTIRPFDHQGTTPFWTGKAAWDESRKMGVLTDIIKWPTDEFLPTEAQVMKMRQ
jgi:branched-chain amino acid transport system substrate-binding protein